MTTTTDRTPRHLAPKQTSRLARNIFATVPIVLVGSLAMSMNLTAPIGSFEHKRPPKDKASTPAELGDSIRKALATAGSGTSSIAPVTESEATPAGAPTTYRVQAGDTISSIAGHYGLSTASVLAMNGLGWKSIIYPGQTLTLSTSSTIPIATPPMTAPAPGATSDKSSYTIVTGDSISKIASRFGVSVQTILRANGLGWSSIIYPGQILAVPGNAAPATPISPAPIPPAAPQLGNGSYVILAGDTISSIANKHGVSVGAVLATNALNQSSIIYAGRVLSIPSTTTVAAVSTETVIPSATPMNAEMATNAATIIAVGRQLGVSDYGLVIALATAMQESSLRNLNWGDRDSLGLFQQRPSTGWGTPAQVTDAVHASRLFFGGPSNPNAQNTRGLLDIPGWKSMPLTQAAQAVQISGHPDAYAKWETSARAWLQQLR